MSCLTPENWGKVGEDVEGNEVILHFNMHVLGMKNIFEATNVKENIGGFWYVWVTRTFLSSDT